MKKIDRTGEEGHNNFGSKMIISKYNNSKDIDVYLPEYNCYVKNVMYKDFKKGNIKCPYEKRTYGIGYIGIYNSGSIMLIVDAYNTTPEESTDDYITNYILPNGTCFDALRYNILDYSSVDSLKNNTNSFRYQITLDTIDKWWNYEYPVEMEDLAKDYLTNFIDNNWEKMQYELLCYMLNKKDQLNNFTTSNLEALYNEYLQIYTYYGFTQEDAVKIKELLLSIAPETYDDSILNYNSVVEEFIEYYILQEEAMYGYKSALE